MLLGVVLVGRALEERAKLQASADMAALQVGAGAGCVCVGGVLCALCADGQTAGRAGCAAADAKQRRAERPQETGRLPTDFPRPHKCRAYSRPRRACCWAMAAGGRCPPSLLRQEMC